MQRELILQEFEDVKKSIALLKTSVKKFKSYDAKKIYTPDELEPYDSLSFRFEKSLEVILSFFKGLEIYLYSKSSDTLRDRLLKIQKLNLIDDVDFWMQARLLRNRIAHSYLPEQIKDIYEEIIIKSKIIFELEKNIKKYFKEK
mgnify:CR=1 FL=1